MYGDLDSLKRILTKNEVSQFGKSTMRIIEGVKTSSNNVLKILVMLSEILDERGINELVDELNFLNSKEIKKNGLEFAQNFWIKLSKVENKDELILLISKLDKFYSSHINPV